MATQNRVPNTPQQKAASTAPTTLPKPPAQQPIPQRHKWLPIILIFAIPLVFLAYRLIDEALHTPETVWRLQQSQAESKQEEAKRDAEKVLNETTDTLQKQARNMNNQDGLPLNIKVLDDTYVDHGCQAVTITGGDKFNTHPVGRNMKCVYAVAKAVQMPRGQTTLVDIADAANASQGTNIKTLSYASERPTLGVSGYVSDYLSSGPLVSYGTDWEKIYRREFSSIQLKAGSDAHIVYAVSTYFIFFDQDL